MMSSAHMASIASANFSLCFFIPVFSVKRITEASVIGRLLAHFCRGDQSTYHVGIWTEFLLPKDNQTHPLLLALRFQLTTILVHSYGSAAYRMAADYAEEQWDAVDHSDEPRLSGSDLTVAVDPDDVGELLERLCGPEVGEENYSEDEEPEMDEPETESDGEGE
jgi:hypothetical protein